ncbi:MAG: UDP-N-acetylglucosamine 1-carboxyvinyltransferase [Coriobacteriia bacterium]|nr:UDP-N-acetylglucosamine 1-carboxyvinyltransferase [Coriobacteriia bacterium]
METIKVQGNGRLHGEVIVEGAKNSALKLMAASLMIEGVTHLKNVPRIADVATMEELLCGLGVVVTHLGPHEMTLDATNLTSHRAPYEVVAKMRASTAVLGPLTARLGKASVALPGGCNIGSRKIDMHIDGLRALGADVETEHGYIEVTTPHGPLSGTEVTLDIPSVGATENLIMAAVLAQGVTVIDNAAREPEISDLIDFLCECGADIKGRGHSHLEIIGCDKLHPVIHSVVGDRIEAGTFIAAAFIAGGPVTVRGFKPEHLDIVLQKLVSAGASVERLEDGVVIDRLGEIKPVDIQTLPYPGFPTDMQAQFMALMSVATGASMISENVFENRFMFADEIGRMGADIRIEGHHAFVKGSAHLSGAPVKSTDLRGGAALVLAGLVADGETVVSNIYHIDRGYEDFCGKLQILGARVVRSKE